MPVLRIRLITGLLQLSRVQARVGKFEESLATINQTDEFILPQFSKPRLDKGVELTLLASKIGRHVRDGNPVPQGLVAKCLEQAKSEFQHAHRLKFNVGRAALSHVDLPKFVEEHEEAQAMLKWIEQEFGN